MAKKDIIRIQSVKKNDWEDDQPCFAFPMPQFIEIDISENQNRKLPETRRLNRREYKSSTGDILEYKTKDSRMESNTIRNSLNKLKRLIYNNFEGDGSELFLTLTYEITPTADQIYQDLRKFHNKLKRRFKKDKMAYDYINCLEPCETGRWHIHVFLKFNTQSVPNYTNKTWGNIWAHGGAYCKEIYDVEGLGKYLFEEKKMKKRIYLYPSKLRIYSYSRGMRHPERVKTTYGQLHALTQNCRMTHENHTLVHKVIEEGEVITVNKVTHLQYKRSSDFMNTNPTITNNTNRQNS